ncbi:glycosyltransferase family 2 protein [Tichowtungia aerotolerans]|uniref:Glycosyltransferase n=1 Tax=Tichowtungia aerotolerans TaxID=2697043 RepID=A0A6P1MAS7_9BACT|nr:glycosyltransferase [Tichowtungia aerotolerans]QHI68225.1 glycosyltransferase [Tichowtungia aerotolerans]
MSQAAVIMRSKDEMPHVPPALQSLHSQTFKDINLWAVDSGSTDGSLEELQKEVPKTQMVQIPPEEYIPGIVLNDMIARTSEDIIVLQNADSIFQSDDALAKLLQPIFDGEADAAMCSQRTRPDAKFIVTYDYLRAYDPKNIKGDNADFFSAVTCAFRRQLWEETRFPEEGYAEDVAWARACRAKGAHFKLVADSVVEHSHNYTLKGLYRKKFRHGVTFAREYGRRANLFFQTLELCKEWARDFLYALRKGRIDTIPYNIAYRAVIHTGLYQGLKEGSRG